MNEIIKIYRNRNIIHINQKYIYKQFSTFGKNRNDYIDYSCEYINKNISFFFKTSRKHLSEHFTKNKKSIYDDINKKSDNSYKPNTNKYDKYNNDTLITYSPTNIMVLKSNKYMILKTSNYDKCIQYFYKSTLCPLIGLSGYKLITSMIGFMPLGSVLWGAFLGCMLRGFYVYRENKNLFVEYMNLLEDGLRIEIKTFDHIFITEIKNTRKLTEEEVDQYIILFPFYLKTHVPLLIDQDIYLISRRSTIFDQNLLNAISNTKNIKLNKENLIKLDECVETTSQITKKIIL